MLVYNGKAVDVYLSDGKVELNGKTSQKDLKKLKAAGVVGIESAEDPAPKAE